MEVTAYRYRQKSDGSVVKDHGKIDIPDELESKYNALTRLEVILTCELLRTGEVAWYLEHEPTQFSLGIIVTLNKPYRQDELLKNMEQLFAQVDEQTVSQRIEQEAYV